MGKKKTKKKKKGGKEGGGGVAEQQDKKILLAVDSFNGCFNPTSLKLGKEEWVRKRIT